MSSDFKYGVIFISCKTIRVFYFYFKFGRGNHSVALILKISPLLSWGGGGQYMQGRGWPLQPLADLPALTLNPRSHLKLDSQIFYSITKREGCWLCFIWLLQPWRKKLWVYWIKPPESSHEQKNWQKHRHKTAKANTQYYLHPHLAYSHEPSCQYSPTRVTELSEDRSGGGRVWLYLSVSQRYSAQCLKKE